MRAITVHVFNTKFSLLNSHIKNLVKSQGDIKPTLFRKDLLFDETGNKRYFDIIRLLSRILEVSVVRNQYSILEGLTIIGKEQQVLLFATIFESIRERINNETRTAQKSPNITLHLSEYKANLKGKYVGKYILMLSEVLATKEAFIDKDYWRKHKALRIAFIQQSPLKTKKLFR